MGSKIIQKEKERQDRYFVEIKQVSEPNENYVIGKIDCHKRSLINLKEYTEGILEIIQFTTDAVFIVKQLKKDIKELNKIVEKYENIHKRHLPVR